MTTWLMDTPLAKMLASPKATALSHWCEANSASLFLSAASLTEITACICKIQANQPQRAEALREWLDVIVTQFADRIHPVDAEISVQAGAVLPHLAHCLPRHRLHDAVLVATARTHGHGLLTRRDAIFGSWTQTPIATV